MLNIITTRKKAFTILLASIILGIITLNCSFTRLPFIYAETNNQVTLGAYTYHDVLIKSKDNSVL